MRRYSLLLVIGVACLSTAASASSRAVSLVAPSHRAVIDSFFRSRQHMLGPAGDARDVTALLALLATDAHYEHPRANIVMSLDDARGGMLAHLRERKAVQITIRRLVAAGDLVVAETSTSLDGQPPINGISVFEFVHDRISRVAEY